MAWERRKGRRYYYRSVRRGGRVFKEYIGPGAVGFLAAAEDAERRMEIAERLAAKRKAERDSLASVDAIARAVDDLNDELKALTDRALAAVGYRNHRGQWRRRR